MEGEDVAFYTVGNEMMLDKIFLMLPPKVETYKTSCMRVIDQEAVTLCHMIVRKEHPMVFLLVFGSLS